MVQISSDGHNRAKGRNSKTSCNIREMIVFGFSYKPVRFQTERRRVVVANLGCGYRHVQAIVACVPISSFLQAQGPEPESGL